MRFCFLCDNEFKCNGDVGFKVVGFGCIIFFFMGLSLFLFVLNKFLLMRLFWCFLFFSMFRKLLFCLFLLWFFSSCDSEEIEGWCFLIIFFVRCFCWVGLIFYFLFDFGIFLSFFLVFFGKCFCVFNFLMRFFFCNFLERVLVMDLLKVCLIGLIFFLIVVFNGLLMLSVLLLCMYMVFLVVIFFDVFFVGILLFLMFLFVW